MKKNHVTYFILFGIILIFPLLVQASELSPIGIFYRCYGKITQAYPTRENPLVKMIKQGQIDPVDACMQVLEKANFTQNNYTTVENVNDKESIKVLQTISQMHHSFFDRKFLTTAPVTFRWSKNLMDPLSPSLFLTKTLLTPEAKFSDILKGKAQYFSKRSMGEATYAPFSGSYFTKEWFNQYGWTPRFIEIGDLLGVTPFSSRKISYNSGENWVGTISQDEHWGGGIIGSYDYMAMNLNENYDLKSNLSNSMPRKWVQSVIKDFTCRDLPVLRHDDVKIYLKDNSNLAFRNESACLRCHATMDQAAGVIRNVRPMYTRTANVTDREISHIAKWPTDQVAETSWQDTLDPNYYRRPLNGKFYYRTFDGKLIDKKMVGVDGLGAILKDLDDTYVCMAKKYYHYFTGISVNINDLADPQSHEILSKDALIHRNKVIQLGKDFKQHQSLKKLIKNIVETPAFRQATN